MATAKETTIQVPEIQTNRIRVGIVGTSPLILNRMSQKARQELLLPNGRKTAAERASSLKHSPLDEYRASPYTLAQEDAPAYLAVMASAFKKLMMTAALDLPGTRKAQIGRLVYVEDEYVPVFGVPELYMSIVRSADINHTPDVRTRAIVPLWAATITVRFVVPLLTEQAIVNLLAAGGVTAGIGDFRPEKGAGNYGQFRLSSPDDEEHAAIVAHGGRAAQIAAMESPECYDSETAELLSWFDEEVTRRGRAPARSRSNGTAPVGA